MFAMDDEGFGECGVGDCSDCAAMPTCPSAKKEAGKFKTKMVKVYRIRKVKGKKGLVMIIPAGSIRCKTKIPVKAVKAGKGRF